jgi:aryl-alcohol dehydrogenase-like predicted oxidoreductase
MQSRKLGGVPVSEIGLGTWQLGSSEWGTISDETAEEIMQKAVDCGVTFFDTADCYGLGLSEKRIGAFLKKHQGSKIFVATKCIRFPPGFPETGELDLMREHVNACRERLGVEKLDLIQLHCPPTAMFKEGKIFDNLRTLQKEGLIERWGASVETVEEALICLQQEGCASLQVIFNIFRQKLIKEVFEQAKAKNVAIIVRLALASGLLSGTWTKDTKFDEKDHRNFNKDGNCFNVGETLAGLPLDKGVELVEKLKTLIPEAERGSSSNLAQFAVRWCLMFDAVTTVIPGATKVYQIESNAAAASLPAISQSTMDAISKFYEEDVKQHIRGPY